MSSYARVRAFSAAALLLLTLAGAIRLNVVQWAQRHAPFSRPQLYAEAPWKVAADAWSRRTLETVLELAATWPPAVAETARAVVERRLKFVGVAPARAGA